MEDLEKDSIKQPDNLRPVQGILAAAQIWEEAKASNTTQQKAADTFDVFYNPKEHQHLFEAPLSKCNITIVDRRNQQRSVSSIIAPT